MLSSAESRSFLIRVVRQPAKQESKDLCHAHVVYIFSMKQGICCCLYPENCQEPA